MLMRGGDAVQRVGVILLLKLSVSPGMSKARPRVSELTVHSRSEMLTRCPLSTVLPFTRLQMGSVPSRP
jgi:hypothetical protein